MGISRSIGLFLFLLFTVSFSQSDRARRIQRLQRWKKHYYYVSSNGIAIEDFWVGEKISFLLDATETKSNGISLASSVSPNLRISELERVLEGNLPNLYRYEVVPTAPGDSYFYAPVWKNGNKEKEIYISLRNVSQANHLFVGGAYNTTEVRAELRTTLKIYGSYKTGDVGWRIKNAPGNLVFSSFQPNDDYKPVHGHTNPMHLSTGGALKAGTYNLELEYVRSTEITTESRFIKIVLTD